MGKSLNGKELGKGISQRKDGLYQARFVNRFGKRKTIELCVCNIQKEHPEFERFSPHCLRHTFDTRAVENAV